MTQNNHTSGQSEKGLWYTYFGSGGAGVFAFLWVVLLLIWIISVLKWG